MKNKLMDRRRKVTVNDLLAKDGVLKVLSEFENNVGNIDDVVLIWVDGDGTKVKYTNDDITFNVGLLEVAKDLVLHPQLEE